MQHNETQTLAALRRALMTTDGQSDTACVIYGTNDRRMAATAFIGDGDMLAGALLAALNHVGEQRATPAEMAITRAVLMAVAAADVRNNGQLQAVIDQHRDDLLTHKVELTSQSGDDFFTPTGK